MSSRPSQRQSDGDGGTGTGGRGESHFPSFPPAKSDVVTLQITYRTLIKPEDKITPRA